MAPPYDGSRVAGVRDGRRRQGRRQGWGRTGCSSQESKDRAGAVTQEHVDVARQAWRRFGKGNHPAALNFGDCFAYALAEVTGEPLLFKGDDFALTDVEAA